MTRLCEHADIQRKPCEGTAFSRAIICKAGLPNCCLRNCSEQCPSYKAARQRSPMIPVQRNFSLPQSPSYNPHREVRTKYQPAAGVPVSGGGCSGCGKAK
jgi:hypothetical protein